MREDISNTLPYGGCIEGVEEDGGIQSTEDLAFLSYKAPLLKSMLKNELFSRFKGGCDDECVKCKVGHSL